MNTPQKHTIMETMIENIKKESNMVGISNIIDSGVFYHFAERFGKEVRKFNRNNETQENWIKSMNEHFSKEMQDFRAILLSNIPSRFKQTTMYKKLYA